MKDAARFKSELKVVFFDLVERIVDDVCARREGVLKDDYERVCPVISYLLLEGLVQDAVRGE